MGFIKKHGIWLAGLCAGAVNGLLGTGGGMVLVPLLTRITDLEEDQIFPASVSIILPVSVVALCLSPWGEPFRWSAAVPYLLGSAAGGILCGFLGKKIPVTWLHRILGILMLWGGIRYLC